MFVLVEKSQQPKWYYVISHRIVSILAIDYAIAGSPRVYRAADFENLVSIYGIVYLFTCLINFMVFPHRVNKERLHLRLYVKRDWIDGLIQIGVM